MTLAGRVTDGTTAGTEAGAAAATEMVDWAGPAVIEATTEGNEPFMTSTESELTED